MKTKMKTNMNFYIGVFFWEAAQDANPKTRFGFHFGFSAEFGPNALKIHELFIALVSQPDTYVRTYVPQPT